VILFLLFHAAMLPLLRSFEAVSGTFPGVFPHPYKIQFFHCLWRRGVLHYTYYISKGLVCESLAEDC
jgi:hypothetical protein